MSLAAQYVWKISHHWSLRQGVYTCSWLLFILWEACVPREINVRSDVWPVCRVTSATKEKGRKSEARDQRKGWWDRRDARDQRKGGRGKSKPKDQKGRKVETKAWKCACVGLWEWTVTGRFPRLVSRKKKTARRIFVVDHDKHQEAWWFQEVLDILTVL